MSIHTFVPTIYYNTFGPHPPALHLVPGDRVITTTLDAHGYDSQGEKSGSNSNPLTGPFFIEGLEPGDTLSVTLEEIRPNCSTAWAYSTPLPGTVEAAYTGSVPPRRILNWKVDLEAQTARLAEPLAGVPKLVVPLSPMLGCIGVAPNLGQSITTYAPGDFGGNMDCPLFTPGCRVELPVFVKGGLLFIGDGHAAQCDGEITGGALEISCDVTFIVQVKKNRPIRWPRGENRESIFTVGSARPLEGALQHATSELHRWLVQEYHLGDEAAGILMSQSVRYVICNVVSPNFSVACCLPKKLL